ncbi:MAG: adenylosuccinate lyase [Candidatus Omnitrophica bacterium CG12_big_fil_rev_8_21_14_0_65_42_8]|nr:MAG: adenylosuccinate lyase [Candidatus Omnitrophica bacterium CG12_big_fil_rev_8_21_14_0_65_42_8]
MIPRYSLPRMSAVWSDENKFQKMLDIEILACEALANLGKIPQKELKKIKSKARFDIKRIEKIEKTTRHDVIAFLHNIAEYIGDSSRFVHQGLTSSDVLDTGLSVMMKESADIILEDLKALKGELRKKANKYKYTIMAGRSHGMHAEPTTFGLKLALFFDEINRGIERINRAKEIISIGKISGPVGTYSNVEPYVERYVCKKLGLRPANVSTQILQRDRHAEYLSEIAIVGATLEKIATEFRNLQKTEVREVEEPFGKGQKGSSAMPHKRNPVMCERIAGLARVLRANAMVSMENVALWHERDISHSSAERIIIPDSAILLDYMLNQMAEIVKGLLVYPENMTANLAKTKGLVFSARILVELEKRGVERRRAYDIIQRCAMKVWEKGIDFKEALKGDGDFIKLVKSKEIDDFFNVAYYTKHVNTIFKKAGI